MVVKFISYYGGNNIDRCVKILFYALRNEHCDLLIKI